MKIDQKEIESVCSLEPFKRYKYFIKRVADSEYVYSLETSEGNWASSTVKDYTLYPVWSAREFALNCAINQWSGFNVIETSLEDFMEIRLLEVEKDGLLLNVFPVPTRTGFVVKIDEFLRDIREELQNYE
jgi:hypothetical protein